MALEAVPTCWAEAESILSLDAAAWTVHYETITRFGEGELDGPWSSGEPRWK
jgi:hypothetical protein